MGVRKRAREVRERGAQLRKGKSNIEKLMTTEQVAEYLNVDKFTVYRLLDRKRLPAFKVGNQWRFQKKMIDAWLLRNSNIRGKRTN
jgi:excisionase family DNA binding protein